MFGSLIEGYLASMDRGCRDLPRSQDFTDNVRNVHLSGISILDLQGSHLPHLIPDLIGASEASDMPWVTTGCFVLSRR